MANIIIISSVGAV